MVSLSIFRAPRRRLRQTGPTGMAQHRLRRDARRPRRRRGPPKCSERHVLRRERRTTARHRRRHEQYVPHFGRMGLRRPRGYDLEETLTSQCSEVRVHVVFCTTRTGPRVGRNCRPPARAYRGVLRCCIVLTLLLELVSTTRCRGSFLCRF